MDYKIRKVFLDPNLKAISRIWKSFSDCTIPNVPLYVNHFRNSAEACENYPTTHSLPFPQQQE